MTSSIYKVLMIWNYVFIDYLGTVEDIDILFFLKRSLHLGVQDDTKHVGVGKVSQEEYALLHTHIPI